MRILRESREGDAAVISRIHAAAWRSAYRGLIAEHYLDRLPDDYWMPSVRAWLGSGRFCGLLLEENGIPVGSVIFGRGRDESHADWGEIVSLYMHPDYMRTGAGKLLLGEALRLLHEDGYTRCYLWMIDGAQSAHAFYLRHGFRPSGEFLDYSIGGQPVRDLLMELQEVSPCV